MPGPIMPISTFIASASTECSTLPPRAGSSSISPPGWMSKPSPQCRSACAGARSALILTPLELLDRFSLPPNRFFSRHSLLPLGEISRYRPPPSNNRMGLSAGLALRIAESLSAILGAS